VELIFSDIVENPLPGHYKRHGQRKLTRKEGERLIGIVEATNYGTYKDFALNQRELADLLAAKRAGRLAGAFVVATANKKDNGDRWQHRYVGQIDAEKLEEMLTGIQPRSGQFGPFYTLEEHYFDIDAPF
jgi:hypothetical protein